MIYKLRNLQNKQAVPIPEKILTVGRDEASDLPIDDASVSRSHARIYNEPEGFFVEDAGSRNGTKVQERLIAEATKVELGEIICFGAAAFRLDSELSGDVSASQPLETLKPISRPNLNRSTAKLGSPEDFKIGPVPVSRQVVSISRPTLPAVTSSPPVNPSRSSAPSWFIFGTGTAFGLILGLLLQKFVLS